METILLKQVHEIKEQIRGFCEWWDHLGEEAEKAEKEREQINNWVRDLLDQRAALRTEIWKMEGKFNHLKEEKESLEASGLSNAGLRVASIVSGESQGAKSGPGAPKKKKKDKQKRHLGLSLEEKQEYYKACICTLGQINFLMKLYIKFQLSSVPENEKTKWILVSHLQLYFSP